MNTSVYFKSLSINKTFNTATIVVSSTPILNKMATIAGIKVETRTQQQINNTNTRTHLNNNTTTK